MSNNFITIIIGSISGIFASAIIYFVSIIYNKHIVPWFRSQVYSGINVEGYWSCVIYTNKDSEIQQLKNTETTATQSYTLSIEKQQGYEISGIFQQDHKDEESHQFGQYKVDGKIRDGYLILSLMPNNKSKSTFGTLLLYVIGGGKSVHGILSYNVDNNEIIHLPLELEKKK